MSLTLNLIVSAAVKTNGLGKNVNLSGMSAPGKNSKFLSKAMSAIRVCINPNRRPMQLRGPSPKGKNVILSRFDVSAAENRSGSNISGFR